MQYINRFSRTEVNWQLLALQQQVAIASGSNGGSEVYLTQEEYDAIATPDENTTYYIYD